MPQRVMGALACACASLLSATDAAAKPCGNPTPQVEAVIGARSEVYRTASGRDLRIHLFAPEGAGPHPAAMFFFGGGWSSGAVTHFRDQAIALQKLGYVVALPDYRVFCRDGTTPDAAVDDARAAYSWLRAHADQLDIDTSRVVVSGGSAGGHLAAMIGLLEPTGTKPAALVLFNPVLDLTLPAITPSVRLEQKDARALSPFYLDKRQLPPTILFQGSADQVVPVEAARAYCAAVNGAGGMCDLQVYDGAAHGFFNRRKDGPSDGRTYYEDTLAKAEQFLARRKLTPGAK